MLFRGKPAQEVTLEDLDKLVGQIELGGSFDYKAELDLRTNDQKREFLNDVSSFANASGGHIVYGVEERDGVASGVPGIPLSRDAVDKKIQEIENIVRDGIEPPIPGVSVHCVSIDDDRCALIIKVPKSWLAPHAAKGKGSFRFYSRRSSGKQLMDLREVRSAFLLSDSLTQRLRAFRVERLMRIQADETPVLMRDTSKAVLHLIPLMAFELGSAVAAEIALREISQVGFPAMPGTSGARAVVSRVNFDGALVFVNAPDDARTEIAGEYRQVFRSGIIEAVHAHLVFDSPGERRIDPEYTKEWLLGSAKDLLAILRKLKQEPPIIVAASFLGVRGSRIPVRTESFEGRLGYPIDRDVLDIPEVLLESYPDNQDLLDLLRPILDTLWNAAGHLRWYGYEAMKTEPRS